MPCQGGGRESTGHCSDCKQGTNTESGGVPSRLPAVSNVLRRGGTPGKLCIGMRVPGRLQSRSSRGFSASCIDLALGATAGEEPEVTGVLTMYQRPGLRRKTSRKLAAPSDPGPWRSWIGAYRATTGPIGALQVAGLAVWAWRSRPRVCVTWAGGLSVVSYAVSSMTSGRPWAWRWTCQAAALTAMAARGGVAPAWLRRRAGS